MASPQLLHLVSYDDKVLHKPSQHVTFPLSLSDTQLIDNMLYSVEDEQLAAASAPWKSAAGMAAPQWGSPWRIFVIQRQYLANDLQFEGSDNFVVAINPQYIGISPSCKKLSEEKHENDDRKQEEDEEEEENVEANEILDEEGCFSVPGMRGVVRRYHTIKATFSSLSGERYSLILSGWPARVFQHETDHIEGRLYDNADAARCISSKKV